MSSTGAMLTQVVINDGMEICTMAWSCEKFNMDENDAKSSGSDLHADQPSICKYMWPNICKYTNKLEPTDQIDQMFYHIWV